MAYCTKTEIEKLLPPAELVQLTDDDNDGVADTAVIDEAIAHADGLIDGYCQERYAVPFASVPELVKNISVDIAIYFFYSRRDLVQETRQKRYEEALRLLGKIAEGKISLGASPAIGEVRQSLQSTTEDKDRVFDDDTLENF